MVRVCAMRVKILEWDVWEGGSALTLWVDSPVGCSWSQLGGFGAAQGDGDDN